MAWEIGVKKIIVETNSITIYDYVWGSSVIRSTHANVVHRCKQWLMKNWVVKLHCIFKEANKAANHLGKSAHSI